MSRTKQRASRALHELTERELGWQEVGQESLAMLKRRVPADACAWMAIDPATLMPTTVVRELPTNAALKIFNHPLLARLTQPAQRYLHNKGTQAFIREDLAYNDKMSIPALSIEPTRVVSLQQLCRAQEGQAPHPRTGKGFIHFHDDLRIACRSKGQIWGVIVMGRFEQPFTAEELAIASDVADVLGTITRLTFLREAAMRRAHVQQPPGLIMLSRTGTVDFLSPDAANLCGDVDEHDPTSWLTSLLESARAGGPANLTVPGPRGIFSAHLTTMGQVDTVIVERARPYTLAGVLVRAYGLSIREQEVTQGMARGWSTRQIAFELDMADGTVQSHLKSIFSKVGVRSRREVLAKLFLDHFLPNHEAQEAPSPYGFYLTPASTS